MNADTTKNMRRLIGLRRASLLLCVLLIAEYALGMGVNIYVTVPKADQGGGMGKAFGDALSKGPAALAIHATLGLLLLLAAVGLFVQAILARHRTIIATATVTLLAVIGAANSGASFVDSSKNSASMAMAMLTAVALLCTVANLYILTGPAAHGRAATD